MRILTGSGIDIECLPDCGRCKVSGKNPEQMDMCPIYNFDDFGDLCVPELCDEYSEEDTDG